MSSRQRFRMLATLIGIGLLAWLILRIGTGSIIEQARAVGWGIVLILALGGISHLLRTWAWRLTFRSDIRSVSLARTFALRLISEAIGNFGFAGQVVGDTVRVSLLGKTVPVADRISSVALDRGLYMITAAVLSVSGVLASVLLLPLPPQWRVYALLFAGGLAILLVLTFVSFGRRWPVLTRAADAVKHLPGARKWLANKISVIESVEEHLLSFHSQVPTSFWCAVVLYFISQILAVAEVYLLLRFMGVRITAVGALVIEAFTKLISVVGAVNPGNVGTYEGGNLLLARMLRFTPAAGFTLALCRRARSLFWAGIGALCLAAFRRKEETKPESTDGRRGGNQPDRETAGNASELRPRDSTAVIIVVEGEADRRSFVPALARVGGLSVLLRSILSAEEILQPSRIVLSLPSSVARVIMDELRRTQRLPLSVECRERKSSGELCSLLRKIAVTADRVVLLSGTSIYKLTLLQTSLKWQASSDAFVLKTDTEFAGVCVLSQALIDRLADDGRVGSFEDLQTWIENDCSVTITAAAREQWQKISTPTDTVKANRKLDSWLVKPTDGIFARFNRRISIPISHQLIKTPITPNAVTFFVLGVSVAGAFSFSRGGYGNMLLGAVLSVWASILDGCDGEVARMKLLSSEFGCWLDTICDYVYYLLTFAGITWGLNRSSAGNLYLGWGAMLVLGAVLSFFAVSMLRRCMAADHPDKFLARFHNGTESRSSNPLLFLARHTEFIIRRCFFPYALLVAAFLSIIKVVFIMTAIGANLVWMIALYSSFALSKQKTANGLVESGMQPNATLNAPL